MRGLQQHGYSLQVFHYGNCIPRSLRDKTSRPASLLKTALDNHFIGAMAQQCMTNDVVAIISNGPIGWYRFQLNNDSLKQIHFYHGTYRAAANAIQPFLPLRNYGGYLRTVWWESMVKENLAGRGKLCVANSDQIRDEVKRYFGHDCTTVWLPLDTKHFIPLDPVACRKKLNLNTQRPVGLFVGYTGLVKNFAMVQKLIDHYPALQWILALRGNVPGNLQHRQNVLLFKDASYELLPTLYNAADFSLCPSHNEPFGYVVAEALACGTPVIATPGGASRRFLRQAPFNSLLIPDPNDVNKFVAAIETVLANPTDYRRLVLEQIRPQVEEIMAPANWWRRFLEVTGL
jgi:glycosyltransferase involved in cell wall biosynthesis